MLDVRFVNPTISYAEKFMDHAFLASVIRNPVVPPLDPWFAGGTLNVYYYLGYWMLGCLSIVSGVPSNIAFNLCSPDHLCTCRRERLRNRHPPSRPVPLAPAPDLPHPEPLVLLSDHPGKSTGSVVWDSTRTITNTINEYPLFSFIWGDVHAHVISIFNQCFLIFLLLFAYKRWESLDTKGRDSRRYSRCDQSRLDAPDQHLGCSDLCADHYFHRPAHPPEDRGRPTGRSPRDCLPLRPSAAAILSLPAVLPPAPDPHGRDRHCPDTLGSHRVPARERVFHRNHPRIPAKDIVNGHGSSSSHCRLSCSGMSRQRSR